MIVGGRRVGGNRAKSKAKKAKRAAWNIESKLGECMKVLQDAGLPIGNVDELHQALVTLFPPQSLIDGPPALTAPAAAVAPEATPLPSARGSAVLEIRNTETVRLELNTEPGDEWIIPDPDAVIIDVEASNSGAGPAPTPVISSEQVMAGFNRAASGYDSGAKKTEGLAEKLAKWQTNRGPGVRPAAQAPQGAPDAPTDGPMDLSESRRVLNRLVPGTP